MTSSLRPNLPHLVSYIRIYERGLVKIDIDHDTLTHAYSSSDESKNRMETIRLSEQGDSLQILIGQIEQCRDYGLLLWYQNLSENHNKNRTYAHGISATESDRLRTLGAKACDDFNKIMYVISSFFQNNSAVTRSRFDGFWTGSTPLKAQIDFHFYDDNGDELERDLSGRISAAGWHITNKSILTTRRQWTLEPTNNTYADM